MRRLLLILVGCLFLAASAQAATLSAVPISNAGTNLSTTQTGNAVSTNTMDRGYTLGGPVLLRIVSTVGATPTVTVDVEGSMDGSNFFNIPYSLPATPDTWTVAAITITTATTGHYFLRPASPWRYLRITYSANTNVTLTTDAFCAWH